ncbi:MAG: DEAD/DEAH box helicase [Oscillospiraceae bacterium]|nr:DEAD/DEAH box helicase [Oscillospiraceae bacterium]MCL2280166.1 DEAD/DEAH box helicase [Oscillospiraceae bacterium]
MNLKRIKEKVLKQLPETETLYGEILFNNCDCQLLAQSAISIDFLVNTLGEDEAVEYSLLIDAQSDEIRGFVPQVKKKIVEWDRHSYACLLQYEQELSILDPRENIEHKKYTRQGMINRVIDERRHKADKADYRIKWAENIYGDHTLTNEQGTSYKVFLRDFEAETGYSDSPDSRLNKLGTTKHIMFAFNELKRNNKLYSRLGKTYPFIEIFCDPQNEYKITWFYPHKLPVAEQLLISRYFKNRKQIENNVSGIKAFLGFIEDAENFESICIRPEVREKVERAFELSMLKELAKDYTPDYSIIKAELFPYQKEGVEFVLFRNVAIIADEMGLGKTVQAATAAVLKKQVFGFNKTLVVCPATLKSQWKKEIEKFTNEKALIVSGTPKERESQYLDKNHYFLIVNYETIMRDNDAINRAGIDFMILDEAQRVKNFETKTSSAIKRLQPKHTLVITGTPIENRLIDIFSVVSVLDPYFFGPLWEFSYQHCLFDPVKTHKINGYYNLQALNSQLSEILIRREKRNVLDQLPNVRQIDIPIALAPKQAEFHASYSTGIAKILRKKFLTAFDMQMMQMLLSKMRMVCDSTYLVDEYTNVSPKMDELENILFEQFDLKNNNRKIIIFSEWVKVHKLIGQMLRKNKIGFVELSGKVPVKLRGELIKKFENSPECKIFMSTEAGGAGLNLQVADTLINFELPWNPAKKNQRIGRIDRLGQKSTNLTIYNFITRNSIEQQIAAGLLVKQNLFEGVLDSGSKTDYVDFSSKGRSQFIEQLEAFISPLKVELTEDIDEDADSSDIHEESTQGDAVGTSAESAQQEDDLTEGFELADAAYDSRDTPQESEPQEEAQHFPEEKEATSLTNESKADEFEKVMTNGMQFLAGLYKMSTGKDMGMENGQVKINKETGEVTMTFKLPM